MATTQYIGARYVPLFAEPAEWDSTRQYEPLTIVLHEGNSYTSKQYVPAGIEITNEKFWALTGNYNAQVESYRKEVHEVLPFEETPTEGSTKGVTSDGIKKAISASEKVSADAISAAEKTSADAIASESTRAKAAEKTNADAIATETTRAIGEETKLNTSLASSVNQINSELNTIKYKNQYPIMLSYSNYTNIPGNIKLYCSYDFVNYMDCGLVKDENGNNIKSDAKNVCITNDSLYLVGSGVVYKATDNLRSFKKVGDVGGQLIRATGFANAYGVSLYYDNDSGFLYTYGALSNSTTDNFIIYGCRIDNDTLNLIDSPIPITLQGYNNVIDPFVIKHDNILYMAFKDETNKKLHIATGTIPLGSFTPNEEIFSHYGEGFEAPKLIEIDGRLIMFTDGYSVRADGNTRQYGSESDVGYFQCNGWFNVEKDALCNIIHFSRDIYTKDYNQFSKARHPCYFKLNTFVKNLFDNTDINPIMVKCEAPYAYIDVKADNTGAKYIVTNAPMLYRFTGANNITIGYSSVFNQNCITYIQHSSENTKISIDSSIIGGSDTGRYICNDNREICYLIAEATSAYPNKIYYS